MFKETLGRRLVWITVALVLLSIIVACAPSATPAPPAPPAKETVIVQVTKEVPVSVTATPLAKGGSIVIADDKFPSGIDPHVQSAWEVVYFLRHVYDTLVYQDPTNGKIVPGLASSWDVSADGKTFTFKLRTDVKFHDGTPFNAAAVKANLDRIVDPATKSQLSSALLGPYDSNKVVDDSTIQIVLKQPFGDLLSGLALPYMGIASPAALKQWGADYQLHQVGTGPFIFKEYIPRDHLLLTKNPDYKWAPSFFQNKGPAYLDSITVKFLPDDPTRVPALQAGDVDMTFGVPANQGPAVQNDPRFSLVINSFLLAQPVYYELNTTKAPTDDLKVRQAIIYGVDRQTVVNAVYKGYYPVAHGPLEAAAPEYSKDMDKLYPYDAAKAKALLDDAGWKLNSATGIREKDGKPLTVLMSLQTWQFLQPTGELIQGQLRQLGIDAQAEVLTYPAQMAAASKGDKNMTVIGGNAFFATDALKGYFHSTNVASGFNWSKIKDPQLDSLIDQGSQTLDLQKRSQIYGQAQQSIMDKALILPIFDYAGLIGVNKKIQGLRWDYFNLGPLLNDAYVQK